MATAKEQQRKRRYEEKRKGQRSRCWACIIYPESMPENWEQLLSEKHMPVLVSPLHDADVNADETEKKAHRHVMTMFPGPVSVTQAERVFEGLNGTCPQLVHHTEAYARYLVHLDNPEKAQYNPEEVIAFAGANWYETAYSQAACDDKILDSVEAFIDLTGEIHYADLVRYARENRPDWSSTIRRRATHITAYMRSLEYKFTGAYDDLPPVKDWESLRNKLGTPKPSPDEVFDLIRISAQEQRERNRRGEFKDEEEK